MKVSAPDPSLMRDLRSMCRKLGLREVLTTKPVTARCVILLSNGAPDGVALTLVCTALDGEALQLSLNPL